jgi:hypothetical protein
MGEVITDFAAEVIRAFVAVDTSRTLLPDSIISALFQQPTAAASTTASSIIRATQLGFLQLPSMAPFLQGFTLPSVVSSSLAILTSWCSALWGSKEASTWMPAVAATTG